MLTLDKDEFFFLFHFSFIQQSFHHSKANRLISLEHNYCQHFQLCKFEF